MGRDMVLEVTEGFPGFINKGDRLIVTVQTAHKEEQQANRNNTAVDVLTPEQRAMEIGILDPQGEWHCVYRADFGKQCWVIYRWLDHAKGWHARSETSDDAWGKALIRLRVEG